MSDKPEPDAFRSGGQIYLNGRKFSGHLPAVIDASSSATPLYFSETPPENNE